MAVANPDTWNYDNIATQILHRSYQITKVDDIAGNVEAESIKRTFWYDNQKASATITYPAHGSETTASPKFEGTYWDDLAGVSGVKVKIQRESDGYEWDGSGW